MSNSSGVPNTPEAAQKNQSTALGHEVSNEAFIAAVFHTLPVNAVVAVCTKPGDPSSGGWYPLRAQTQCQQLTPVNNNYVNGASVMPLASGEVKVTSGQAAAVHFLMLDDVGTKVPREKLEGLMPTWEIETSPGNSQIGLVFEVPMRDPSEFKSLQAATIATGLCDPGANGLVRWARLPHGVNGKAKHQATNGQHFQCRMTQWNPEQRFSCSAIMDVLRLTPVPCDDRSGAVAVDVPVPAESRHPPYKLADLASLLGQSDANLPRDQWIRVLMAVWHETNGSAAGFDLVDAWSRPGKTYPGREALLTQWRSFRATTSPVTVGTLIKMVNNSTANGIAAKIKGEHFSPCDSVRIETSTAAIAATAGGDSQIASKAIHPLARYSIDDLNDVRTNMTEQLPLLGSIALKGQATVIYAQSNTGKTLLTLHLLIEAIKADRVDAKTVYYINMDDNSEGLLAKGGLALEYGFNMLADGYKGFRSKDFVTAIEDMIEKGTAKNVVVILDTLKKFVDTMDKSKSTEFGRVVRRFCLKGGTVIALAHTNKNPAANGKPIYSGTSDIVNDFDCAYTLMALPHDPAKGVRVVEFENIKRRGSVCNQVAYSYACANEKQTYLDLLLSVQEVDAMALAPLKEAAELQSVMPVIDAIERWIQAGLQTKMKLADTVAKELRITKRSALAVIEAYTGEDVKKHRWTFLVGARGAQQFELLAGRTDSATAATVEPRL